MLLIDQASHYICNVFKWSELVGLPGGGSQEQTKIEMQYLNQLSIVHRFNDIEVVALFKKLSYHPNSRYWNHYLLFRYFLTSSQQAMLLNELLLEEDPKDARLLVEELGKWSPDFQRRFLGDLDSAARNQLFKVLDPLQLIELSLSLTNAIYDHPNTFCERYI